ncbi:MAG: S49 family peptidase [Aquamicrobium sp.]|nr:S49 family peptidase [Aquamicrobium sp.]
MSRLLKAITAEPWAIYPDYLHRIAAIAQRNLDAPEVRDAGEWQKRDYDMLAGPGAQRLAGAHRAMVSGGVAVIPVMGPIFPRANMMTEYSGATSITMLQNDHQAALASQEVGAIMLLIDSPGGVWAGVDAFATQVAAGAKKKQTMSFISGLGASAAYWIAVSGTEVVADRTALVGSIGVAIATERQVEPDSDGYLQLDIASSNAPAKRPDLGTEDGMNEIKATLDGLEAIFIGHVAASRNVSVDKVKSDFGRGGIKVSGDAKASGMIDRVQSYDAALQGLRRAVANQRRLDELKR